MIGLIAARELRAQLHSFTFWLLLAAVSGLLGWLMFAQLQVYQQISPQLQSSGSTLGINDLILAPTLNSLGLLLLLAVPLLSMQSLADERASGRLHSLLASPLGIVRLLLGKWLGNSAAGLVLMLLGLAIPASLALGTTVDTGRLLGALFSLSLLVLMLSAVSLMCSAFSRQPAAALAASYGLLLTLWLLDSLSTRHQLLYWLALNPVLDAGLSGRIDASLPGYFLLLTTLALLTAGVRLLRDRNSTDFIGLRGRLRSLSFALLSLAVLWVAMPMVRQSTLNLFDTEPAPPQALLQALHALRGPLVVTAYAPRQPLLRAQIEKLLSPLRRHYRNFQLHYVDPLQQPQLARELGIQRFGELTLEAMGRSQHIVSPNPGKLLRAISQLARRGQPWVLIPSGYGEADPSNRSPTGLSSLAAALSRLGFQPVSLDMRHIDQLPDNLAAILIAAPTEPYPPSMISMLQHYLAKGGRILWLQEQPKPVGLTRLSGIQVQPKPGDGLLSASPKGKVWTSPGAAQQDALFDGDVGLSPPAAGPWREQARLLPLGSREPIALALQSGKGRLIAVGDSDFARNSLFGRAGNSAMTLAMFNWLTHNQLATAPPVNDLQTHWSATTMALLALFELVLLPAALLLNGWRIRRRRLRA